ncbi:MAG: 50S ribosomal protein L9 [Clostridia bacterium]|nr:50S ribosomal protein L9 [Clostridia bacterium]
MKVILLDNIKGVGKKDEVINASDGYARNFLFPKKLAVEANNENMNKLKAKKQSEQYKKDVEKENAQKIAKQLDTITLNIKVKAGENGKIFGGVTSKEISEELKKQCKIDVDKKKIVLNENIKNIGSFDINIKLYEGVTGKLKVKVISEN